MRARLTVTFIRHKSLSNSSQIWLQRQRKDQFVKKAQKEGYSSRASFKILQILEDQPLLKTPQTTTIKIVDLGAAPGSWSQALAKHFKQIGTPYEIIAVDKQKLAADPPAGVSFILGDFTEKETKVKIGKLLNNDKADAVVSDMAPAASGDKQLDHARLANLSEEAFYFSQQYLKQGGLFVAKFSHGTYEQQFKQELKDSFKVVKLKKPPASRKDSNECFFLCTTKQ